MAARLGSDEAHVAEDHALALFREVTARRASSPPVHLAEA